MQTYCTQLESLHGFSVLSELLYEYFGFSGKHGDFGEKTAEIEPGNT